MNGDITVKVNDMYLNIRVGMIFKYNGKVLIEIHKNRVGNSVIPGGRLKINESRIDAIKREIKEEMNYVLEDNRIIFKDTIENFYEFDNQKYHELFFVYEYVMDDEIYHKLEEIKENSDNPKTEYIFVGYDEFDEVYLLPMELRSLIKE